ncbi:MAG TPA: protein phosphatase 2C domain-containing protein [Mycobacteriales bacterium]|nr:protein phosphatase 2C domain-containing protein [Mycobacteriales bacterium]
MDLGFDFGAVSDLGVGRGNNEDSAYCSGAVLAVADGVGGGPAGEVASTIAVEALRGLEADVGRSDDPRPVLRERASIASARLDAAAREDPAVAGMATTLTAVLMGRCGKRYRRHGAEVGLLHVGDSRLYVSLAGQLFQLTRDHSLPQLLVDRGQLSAADAEHHPQRSMIVRSLQSGVQPEVDLVLLLLLEGQRLLLCSDGLSDYVPAPRISELLTKGPPQAAAEGLLEEALGCGSRDNITVVVADVLRRDGLPETSRTLGAAEAADSIHGTTAPHRRGPDVRLAS